MRWRKTKRSFPFNSRFIRLFITLLAVVLLYGGCSMEEAEIVSIDDVRLIELKEDKLFFELDVTVHNPNGYTLKLSDADVGIYLNGQFMGQTELGDKLKINGKTTEQVTARLITDLSKSGMGLILNLVSSTVSGSLEMKIKGEVRAGCCLIIRKKFDIEHSEQLKISDYL